MFEAGGRLGGGLDLEQLDNNGGVKPNEAENDVTRPQKLFRGTEENGSPSISPAQRLRITSDRFA